MLGEQGDSRAKSRMISLGLDALLALIDLESPAIARPLAQVDLVRRIAENDIQGLTVHLASPVHNLHDRGC